MKLFRYIFSACLLTGLFVEAYAQPLTYEYRKAEAAREKAIAIEFAKAKGWPIEGVLPNGRIYSLIRLDAEGKPQYFSSSNLNAARTISTNRVWTGGNLGLNLNGQGMPTGTLGEWDGGAVRTTHQEFGGRVTQIDGASTLSDHATHVAGTLVAGGVGSPNYKGMAHQASLNAYDWNNDVGEMSTAGSNGMLVSNHSYGLLTGFQWGDWSGTTGWHWWGDPTVSITSDYRYGFYDDEARDWDIVARSFPNYLIVKAAGNDRGDGPASGGQHYVLSGGSWVSSTAVRSINGGSTGYDCISGSAISKNILTVGAVNDLVNGYTTATAVTMSSFSGWGPTDDGRIKPDVVGNGVSVTSSGSSSNTNYMTMSGTSMASPNIAGSAYLLQQRYRQLNANQVMRAATLKGLIIHTADEAGPNLGPDYMFGWGLMNTAKAATLIGQNGTTEHIIQGTLVPGQPYTLNFATGIAPLRITLSWSDLPATVSTPVLNSNTSKLVNDLDLRITSGPMGIRFPYVLNPSIPSAAATTGDNFRDNVEQIYIANPTSGSYTLTISNKPGMTSNQPFSLIISNATLTQSPPTADFSSTNPVVCSGSTVSFTPNTTGVVTSYNWSFPGGTPSTSTSLAPTIAYNTPGQYQVQLIVSGPSGSDTMLKTQYVKVGGNTLPFSEDFTNGIDQWTVVNPNFGSMSWALDSNATFSAQPNKSAWMNFYAYQTVGQRDELISPPLNLVGTSSAQLNFKHAYTRYGGQPSDTLIVQASSGCSNNWVTLATLAEDGTGSFATAGIGFFQNSNFVPTQASQWCGSVGNTPCNTLSLNNFLGQSGVRIRFLGVNSYGNNLYLDDINVSGNTSALSPIAAFGATSSRVICSGGSVSFRDSSLNVPTSRMWTFNGGVPATSTAINPTVTYSNPGVYAVKLRVTNAQGSDSLTRTAYITVTGGQSIPLSENFESMTSGLIGGSWTVDNPDNLTTWGTTITSGSPSGIRSAWMNFYSYNNAIGQRDGLETPLLDFRNRTNIVLSFRHAYTRYNTQSSDSLIVLIQTGCSGNWTRLATYGEDGLGNFGTTINPFASSTAFIPASIGDWCGVGAGASCANIPLDAYAGQGAVRLRFESVNNYGNNLYLDDIAISGTSTIQAPVVRFGAISSRTICANNTVSFRDSSTNSPTSWNWSFPGGIPSTSTAQHPTITYNSPGTYAVSLTATNSAGSNSLTKSGYIVVGPTLNVIWSGPPATACINAAPINLVPGTPSTGTFSGPGVFGNSFIPLLAGVGTHNLVYSVTQNGCTDTARRAITVFPKPSITFNAPGVICANSATISPSSMNFSPAGGLFTGPGVVGGSFSPSLVGPGAYTLTYSVSQNGCQSDTSFSVQVGNVPMVNLPQIGPYCANSASIMLNMGTPAGGAYTVNGIQALQFNPTTLGQGNHTVIYSFSQNGCIGRDTIQVLVTNSVSATFQAPPSVCSNDSAFMLTGGSPLGGTYSGNGVVNNRFNPALAGAGTHTLTYTAGPVGCQGVATTNITVKQAPNVSIVPVNAQCDNATIPVTLSASPLGGVFSGPGVSGNSFSPSIAGAGNKWVSYSVTQNGCTDLDSIQILINAAPLVSLLPLAPVCVNALPITLSGGTPSGGVYSGSGVSNGQFNPAVAGPGSAPIFYTYAAPNGCISIASQIQVVNGLPTIIFPPIPTACQRDTALSLLGVIPTGGVFTGTGVTGVNFNPQQAGPGTHSITYFIAVNGCLNSSTQSVLVAPQPVTPSLTSSGFNAISSSNPIGNRWFLGSVLLNDTGQVIVPTMNGIYRAVTVINNCASDTSLAFAFTTLNNVNVLLSNVVVYPNPTEQLLWMDGLSEGDNEIKIVDARGSVLSQISVNHSGKAAIDLSSYSSGIYFIQLTNTQLGMKVFKVNKR